MRSWSLSVLVIVVAITACSEPVPCTCPPAPAPLACPTAPLPSVVGDSPNAQLALEITAQLFARDFAPVRAHFTRSLDAELSNAQLEAIMVGLAQAHGAPTQIMDAWSNTFREDDVTLQGAQVVIKMANDVRLGVKLVFDPQGAIKGLWIRPI